MITTFHFLPFLCGPMPSSFSLPGLCGSSTLAILFCVSLWLTFHFCLCHHPKHLKAILKLQWTRPISFLSLMNLTAGQEHGTTILKAVVDPKVRFSQNSRTLTNFDVLCAVISSVFSLLSHCSVHKGVQEGPPAAVRLPP